jgi:UDP-N-acetyl-D-glucosamine dehydrogenase
MEKLEKKGASVKYNDPFVPVVPPTREHDHFTGKKSVKIEDTYDLILVSTNHSEYRNFDFRRYSCPLVDSRNCIEQKPKKYFQA